LDVVRRLAIKRLLRHAELARCLCHFCPRSCPCVLGYQKLRPANEQKLGFPACARDPQELGNAFSRQIPG
ncbi:hypothetical protein, partial [Allomesorhizobium alhagi]|uniref:hypothetical protein n=1 Tax=Allomesorhizobium alhagi TaxID=475067 RepID=UPI001AEC0439